MSLRSVLGSRGRDHTIQFGIALIIVLMIAPLPASAQLNHRGDVNLNGVPYEVADWDLFASYFLIGDSAFTIDPPTQRLATDVTAEGLQVTMLDFIYFYRILRGLTIAVNDTIWFGYDSLHLTQDKRSHTITMAGLDSLAGLSLKFKGSIVPDFHLDTSAFVHLSHFDGVYTRVVIYPKLTDVETTPRFGAEGSLTYQGDGEIVSASAADYSNVNRGCIITIIRDTRRATVNIASLSDVQPGELVEVPVYMTTNGPHFQFSGFNLVLIFDTTYMTLTTVTRGSLLANCQWQYLNYDVGPAAPLGCGYNDCRMKKIHVVGQADIGSGLPPSCSIDTGGVLFDLVFRVSSDTNSHCQDLPLDWAWYYCNDNVFIQKDNDTLVLSDEVLDDIQGHFDYITLDQTLPTVHGAPANCVTAGKIRGVRFISNSIAMTCNYITTGRGDLNYNSFAYEVADELLYQQFFLKGRSVFTEAPAIQIENSDVNADGIPLTVADLMYTSRIIIGDAWPIQKIIPKVADTAVLIQDTLSKTISLVYADTLSALHLVFDGPVQPTSGMLGIDTIKYEIDSGITRVLITPPLPIYPYPMPTFGSGLLFSYTGDGQLTSVDAALDGTVVIPSKIQGSSAASCCRRRGNVEGTNDPSESVDIADLTLLVEYMFSGATLTCWAEADVNGDGTIDVSDITALVDFLFFAGRIPPCQ